MSNPEGNSAESERCGHRALSGWAGPLCPPYARQEGVRGERQVGVLQRKEARQCTAVLRPALECPSPFLPLNPNLKALMFWAPPRVWAFWVPVLRTASHRPPRSCSLVFQLLFQSHFLRGLPTPRMSESLPAAQSSRILSP